MNLLWLLQGPRRFRTSYLIQSWNRRRMWMVFRPSSLDDEPLVWDGRDFALFSTLTNPVNPVLAFPVNLRPRTILQLMKISRFQLCCQLKKTIPERENISYSFCIFYAFTSLKDELRIISLIGIFQVFIS